MLFGKHPFNLKENVDLVQNYDIMINSIPPDFPKSVKVKFKDNFLYIQRFQKTAKISF